MATIYVHPSGSNANPGTLLLPVQTIAYALSICSDNDTVYCKAGTHTINSQITWNKDGVNLIGESKLNTTVLCLVTNNCSIVIYDNDTHVFSDITFDGQLTGLGGIATALTNGLSVHDCTFKDFVEYGLSFGSSGSVYCTDNEAYNNTFTNCSKYDVGIGSPGSLSIFWQIGFLCHDNVITQPKRGVTPAGFGIKTNYTKGLKIYNNTVSIPENNDAANWAFCMELWNTSDDCEIYGNTINGPVDFAGDYTVKGSGTYSVKLYDNYIGHNAMQETARVGLLFESESVQGLRDFHCYGNQFENLETAITISTRDETTRFQNIFIHTNIINGIGISGNSFAGAAIGTNGNPDFEIDTLKIYGNTIVSEKGDNDINCIVLPGGGIVGAVEIYDNIITDFGGAVLTSDNDGTGSIDSVLLDNNCLYNNGYSNLPIWGEVTPGTVTITDNINVDPLLNVDFSLKSNSPCITLGMGAVEYVAPPVYVGSTVYDIDILNLICSDLGIAANHYYRINALNAICASLGLTSNHLYDLDALNVIAVSMGATASIYEIEALNKICIAGGGIGGWKYDVDALNEIQVGGLINQTDPPSGYEALMDVDDVIIYDVSDKKIYVLI